jgi:hypothetical protein
MTLSAAVRQAHRPKSSALSIGPQGLSAWKSGGSCAYEPSRAPLRFFPPSQPDKGGIRPSFALLHSRAHVSSPTHPTRRCAARISHPFASQMARACTQRPLRLLLLLQTLLAARARADIIAKATLEHCIQDGSQAQPDVVCNKKLLLSVAVTSTQVCGAEWRVAGLRATGISHALSPGAQANSEIIYIQKATDSDGTRTRTRHTPSHPHSHPHTHATGTDKPLATPYAILVQRPQALVYYPLTYKRVSHVERAYAPAVYAHSRFPRND